MIVCSCTHRCGQSNWQTVSITWTSCLWLMHSLAVVKVFTIGLVDCCVRAIFIAVKRHACSRSSTRPESIIRMTIVAIKRLRLSLQLIKSFAIIIAVELLVRMTFVAAELALSRSSSWLNLLVCAIIVAHPSYYCYSWTSCLRSFLRSKESLVIIIATELESSCDHSRNQTPSFASILMIDAIVCDHHRKQIWLFKQPSSRSNLLSHGYPPARDTHSRSSSWRNLRGRATIIAIELAHSQLSSQSRHSLTFIITADLARSYQCDDCHSWTEQ